MAVNNGGVIGKINTPTTSLASGVWSLGDQFESQSSEIWPLAFPLKGIGNACRFDDGSSDKLSKNIASSGNRKTWTWSAWIKRANIPNANMDLFGTPYVSLSKGSLYIDTSERLYYAQYESGGGSNNFGIRTTRVFRDPSAWYHIVLIWDTTNATGDDRIRLYINGTRETDLSLNTNPTLNYDGVLNNSTHDLFIGGETSSLFFDGYMAEVCFIDGQALEPSSFGATDPVSGVWCPKPISTTALTFGNNGFYLDFANSGALGTDVSGNGNNFTVNNLTSIDQTTDTAVNNYCTLNPLSKGIDGTLSEGNLSIDYGSASSRTGQPATIGVSQGKWYWEVKASASSSGDNYVIGIAGTQYNSSTTASYSIGYYPGYTGQGYGYFAYNGNVLKSDSAVVTLNTYTTGDIIGIALDLDNDDLYFYKNGTIQNGGTAIDISSVTPDYGVWFPAVGDGASTNTCTLDANFGNPPFTISSGNSDANGYGNFEYAVPSGYYALNTNNLAEYG